MLILPSGVRRRPQGVVIGTALQVALLLTGLLNSVMFFLGGVFALIWLYLLQVRRAARPPFGARRRAETPR